MASVVANKRLTKEYKQMQNEPTPYIVARPREENILEWHYIITGPPATPYAGGQYHGTLIFPRDYPFKPPAIRMVTPSGRFRTNTRLCLSISDYHPETWNPAWTVETIMTGLLSFMTSNDITTGAIQTTDGEKKKLAAASQKWNATSNRIFREVFPDFVIDTDAQPAPSTTNSLLSKVASSASSLLKRKSSHDAVYIDDGKRPKSSEVVNLDSDEEKKDDNEVVLIQSDDDDDNAFYDDYDPFSSDEGEIDNDNDGDDDEAQEVVVID